MHLIRHEMSRHGFSTKAWFSGWIVVLAICALVIGLQSAGWAPYGLIWYGMAAVLFMGLGFAHETIHREWSEQTASWWLTLPHPPAILVRAKVAACLRRTGLIAIVLYLTLAGAQWLSIQIAFSSTDSGTMWETAARWLAIVVCLLPVVVTFGVYSGILGQSGKPGALPIWWVVFWLIALSVGYVFLFTTLPIGWLLLGAVPATVAVSFGFARLAAGAMNQVRV